MTERIAKKDPIIDPFAIYVMQLAWQKFRDYQPSNIRRFIGDIEEQLDLAYEKLEILESEETIKTSTTFLMTRALKNTPHIIEKPRLPSWRYAIGEKPPAIPVELQAFRFRATGTVRTGSQDNSYALCADLSFPGNIHYHSGTLDIPKERIPQTVFTALTSRIGDKENPLRLRDIISMTEDEFFPNMEISSATEFAGSYLIESNDEWASWSSVKERLLQIKD